MKELLKRIKALQQQGYEYITIHQLLIWISEIQREQRLKRAGIKDR